MIRQTRTYAELEVSKAVYSEILGLLLEAGYEHAIDTKTGLIDMQGIALNWSDPDART